MKVSIITATYNSERTIKDNLASVKNQTYRNLEHIVIDGASTDKTVNLLQLFGHDGPLVSEADGGIYDAMNKGVGMATGDIIGILNSDDFYPHASVIDNVVKAFQDLKCDAVYGDLVFVDEHNSNKVVRKWVAGNYRRNLFYSGWMPPHPTVFIRKEVYEKYGGFNLKFKSSSDYELLLRLMFINKIKVNYLPGVMVHMRTGGQSTKSLKNRLAAHKEDYLAWLSNGVFPKWYTLAMKPFSKILQFLVAGNGDYNHPMPLNTFYRDQRISN
jgi:glycosyltransferase